MNSKALQIPLSGEYLPRLAEDDAARSELQRELDTALAIADEADAFVVKDQASFEQSAQRRQICRAASNKTDAYRKTFTDPLNASIKRWINFFRTPIDRLDTAAEIYQAKALQYNREQERLAAQARAEAELKAAKEKARLDREAERIAKQLEKKGENDAAAAVRQSVPDVPPVPEVVAPEKPAGTSIIKYHRGEVMNFEEMVKAVAHGTAPLTLLKADMSALNKFASATKGSIAIPGVRFYIEETISQR